MMDNHASQKQYVGAQRLIGRVHGLRRSGCWFKAHRHHCVVSLSKTHFSWLSKGLSKKDLSRLNSKIVDWDEKDQIKQTNAICSSKKDSRDAWKTSMRHHVI